MRLAHSIAQRYIRNAPPSKREVFAGDIRSAALEGLVKAATDFDPSYRGKFSVYAYARIRGQVLDFIRSTDHVTRYYRIKSKAGTVELPVAPLSLDWLLGEIGDRLPDPYAVDPLVAAERTEAVARFHTWLATLPTRTREAFVLRYRDDWQLKRIGAALGVTESRACQLIREAREAFRKFARQDDWVCSSGTR